MASTSTISIEELHFLVQEDLDCRFTMKIYAEDVVNRTNPSAAAREWLHLQGYSAGNALGSDLAAKTESQFHFSMTEESTDRYHLLLTLEEELEYADISRFSESVLECVSPNPLFASSSSSHMLTLKKDVKLEENTYWKYQLVVP